MFGDNGSELKRFPELLAEVERIISAKRKSNASQKEFEDFKAIFQLYRNQNEATVLAAVLPCIIKDDRTVLIPSEDHSQEAVWESVRFFNEGVMIILDREFKKGYVPFRNGIDEIDVQLVAGMTKLKDRGMTNPKPDRTFGIRRDKYRFPPGFQMPEEIRDFLEVLPEMHLPFLIIEGKAEGGSSAEARNQACRGGAAVVHCLRLLRSHLGYKESAGADHQTYVFSATYYDGLLELWVHWAEVFAETNTLPVYHMSLVGSRAILDEHHFRKARMALHNILEWGSGPRFEGLEPLYEAIVEYSGTPPGQGAKGSKGGGAKGKSPEAKKQKTQHHYSE